ncbi:MAG: ComF family protein [Duncaniella sp.]|nr:ComF family protein [Duncaniella sp.]
MTPHEFFDRMLSPLCAWGKDLIDVIVPERCTVCGAALIDGEEIMCLHCLIGLPRPVFKDYTDNEMLDRLASLRAPVERGAALFNYQHESPYVSLIHDTKYRGRPRVGRTLARNHARELAARGFFDDIDLLLPLPLHPLREFSRGYNQSYEIARGLSEVTGLPIGDNLKALGWHGSQTRLNARERRLNSGHRFGVRDADSLQGLHILVVDDVITTGSTLHSALETLHTAAPTARLSVYPLAITTLG